MQFMVPLKTPCNRALQRLRERSYPRATCVLRAGPSAASAYGPGMRCVPPARGSACSGSCADKYALGMYCSRTMYDTYVSGSLPDTHVVAASPWHVAGGSRRCAARTISPTCTPPRPAAPLPAPPPPLPRRVSPPCHGRDGDSDGKRHTLGPLHRDGMRILHAHVAGHVPALQGPC